ncbi:MAG: type I-E CRISPR-associated protein Cse1/CasA [Acidobacteriota bacterium]
MDLAETLSRLGAQAHLEFDGLRPHQSHAWHAFLVQLAALVVVRSDDGRLDRSAEEWRSALLSLVETDDPEVARDAWTLVVEDPTRPAFLQPSIPEGDWQRYKLAAETPDDLDLLVTAKSHDVKQRTMTHASAAHWAYALLTLQTFQGFSGRGNYGIARMNSGFGNRPLFTAAPGLGWAERFARDVGVWLDQRDTLLDVGYEMTDGGPALLWTLPWDGSSPAIEFGACDPFFLEICRRVRLTQSEGGHPTAWQAPTTSPFLEAKERAGDTGDIWTPVQISDKKGKVEVSSLTVAPSGLTYKKLQDVVFGPEWPRKPALKIREDDGSVPILIFQAMVRGQGKTEGWHERRILAPREKLSWLKQSDRRTLLGRIAEDRVKTVGEVTRRILRPALCALLQGGGDDLNLRDDRVDPWTSRFDRAVDDEFFERLWHDVPADGKIDRETAQRAWVERLRELARSTLEAAIAEAPISEARNYRAIVQSEARLEAGFLKHFSAFLSTADSASQTSSGALND